MAASGRKFCVSCQKLYIEWAQRIATWWNSSKVVRYLDEIPFDRSGLEKAALAMHLLNVAFESFNRERLRARDALTGALGFLGAIAAAGATRPAGPLRNGNDGGSQPAASGN